MAATRLIAMHMNKGKSIQQCIAKRIAETTGADIYEIRTIKAYPKDGYETSDISQEERRTGNLPEIVDDLPDLKEYSTVIIGGPI